MSNVTRVLRKMRSFTDRFIRLQKSHRIIANVYCKGKIIVLWRKFCFVSVQGYWHEQLRRPKSHMFRITARTFVWSPHHSWHFRAIPRRLPPENIINGHSFYGFSKTFKKTKTKPKKSHKDMSWWWGSYTRHCEVECTKDFWSAYKAIPPWKNNW